MKNQIDHEQLLTFLKKINAIYISDFITFINT